MLGTSDWGNPADCGEFLSLWLLQLKMTRLTCVLFLDYKIYEEVVKATHEHRSIFYDAE